MATHFTRRAFMVGSLALAANTAWAGPHPLYGGGETEGLRNPELLPPPESPIDFEIAPVDLNTIPDRFHRQRVDYFGFEPPATLIVDPQERFLFLVIEDGQALLSTCVLSHALPPAPTILFPLNGATGVAVHGSTGSWNPVPGAVGYEVQLDQDDLLLNFKIGTTQDMTSMSFPDSWMLRNRPYVFGVAAIGNNGNVTVSETQFMTGN